MKLADLATVSKEFAQDETLDYTSRLNAAGTLIDFGKVATDGSAKVNLERGRLVVFPYPREQAFTVRLRLGALNAAAGKAAPGKVQVRALKARTREDLGKVDSTLTDGMLTFRVGLPGAGRYVVSW